MAHAMRQPVQRDGNKPFWRGGGGERKKKKKLATAGSAYQRSQVRSVWCTFSLPTSTKVLSECIRRP